ncbi:MAG: hypothetical protein NVS3B7_02050 [Candidatus Elarobacter sp.]
MRRLYSGGVFAGFLSVAIAMAGCGGGSGTGAPLIGAPPTATPAATATPSPVPTSATATSPLSAGAVVPVPAFGGYSGSIGFPADAAISGAITLTASTTPPAGALKTLQRGRHVLSDPAGAVPLPFNISFTVSQDIPPPDKPSFTSTNAFVLNVPPGIPLAGIDIFLAVLDVTNPNAAQIVWISQGTVSGSTLNFAATQAATPYRLFAGHTYDAGFYVKPSAATPVPTATPVVTPVPTATPVVTPVPTATPVVTPVPTATPAVTPVPTATPVVTPVPTATPVVTPVPTATPVVTPMPTPTPAGSSATTTQTIMPSPGSVAIPSFGGFTGTVGFTKNDSSGGTVTMTSSTTPLAGEPPGGSKTVFYLSVTVNNTITFDAGKASGTITSSALSAAKAYTATLYYYGYPVGSQKLGSPINSTLTFDSPISGKVNGGTNAVLEISEN